jgi:hypothetical protein
MIKKIGNKRQKRLGRTAIAMSAPRAATWSADSAAHLSQDPIHE